MATDTAGRGGRAIPRAAEQVGAVGGGAGGAGRRARLRRGLERAIPRTLASRMGRASHLPAAPRGQCAADGDGRLADGTLRGQPARGGGGQPHARGTRDRARARGSARSAPRAVRGAGGRAAVGRAGRGGPAAGPGAGQAGHRPQVHGPADHHRRAAPSPRRVPRSSIRRPTPGRRERSPTARRGGAPAASRRRPPPAARAARSAGPGTRSARYPRPPRAPAPPSRRGYP